MGRCCGDKRFRRRSRAGQDGTQRTLAPSKTGQRPDSLWPFRQREAACDGDTSSRDQRSRRGLHTPGPAGPRPFAWRPVRQRGPLWEASAPGYHPFGAAGPRDLTISGAGLDCPSSPQGERPSLQPDPQGPQSDPASGRRMEARIALGTGIHRKDRPTIMPLAFAASCRGRRSWPASHSSRVAPAFLVVQGDQPCWNTPMGHSCPCSPRPLDHHVVGAAEGLSGPHAAG